MGLFQKSYWGADFHLLVPGGKADGAPSPSHVAHSSDAPGGAEGAVLEIGRGCASWPSTVLGTSTQSQIPLPAKAPKPEPPLPALRKEVALRGQRQVPGFSEQAQVGEAVS